MRHQQRIGSIPPGRSCSVVGAGAVVRTEVPDYALMVGVPAVQKGWVGRHGYTLVASGPGEFRCPASGWRYRETEPGVLRCLDWAEDRTLP